MTANLADLLAKRYINRLESSGKFFSVMDLFDTKKNKSEALNALLNSSFDNVHLTY